MAPFLVVGTETPKGPPYDNWHLLQAKLEVLQGSQIEGPTKESIVKLDLVQKEGRITTAQALEITGIRLPILLQVV